jgi:hypothetical protein
MRSSIILPLLSPVAWAFATYDYVIVGGGTTGLVVANRLTENSSSTLTALIFYHTKINTNAPQRQFLLLRTVVSIMVPRPVSPAI